MEIISANDAFDFLMNCSQDYVRLKDKFLTFKKNVADLNQNFGRNFSIEVREHEDLSFWIEFIDKKLFVRFETRGNSGDMRGVISAYREDSLPGDKKLNLLMQIEYDRSGRTAFHDDERGDVRRVQSFDDVLSFIGELMARAFQ